jgi:hypothetical protein
LAVVLTLVWIAIAAAFSVVVGGLVVVVIRGLHTWRTLRRLLRAVSRHLGELETKAAATEQKAVTVTAKGSRLAQALAHLDQSLAELAVLRAAFEEARGGAGRFRGAVPRK